MDQYTEHRDWMDVLHFASTRGKDWTYIILGNIGPTGKTHLRNQLHDNGYNVIEITDAVSPRVDYIDTKNHYFVYEDSKCVVIMLNKTLSREVRNDRRTN